MKAICSIVVVLGIAATAQAGNHHYHGTATWWPGYYGYGWWPYTYSWYGWYGYYQPPTRHPRLPNDQYYKLRSSGAEARHKYEQEILERQRAKNATRSVKPGNPSFSYNGKKYSSYKEFKRSKEFMDMKARAWMNDLTKKAEKSLEEKKLQENYARTKELRGMSFSKKQHYRNGKVVEKEMGKNWWRAYGPQR